MTNYKTHKSLNFDSFDLLDYLDSQRKFYNMLKIELI